MFLTSWFGSRNQTSWLMSIQAGVGPAGTSPLYLRVKLSHGMSPRGVASIVLYKLVLFWNGSSVPCGASVADQRLVRILMFPADI